MFYLNVIIIIIIIIILVFLFFFYLWNFFPVTRFLVTPLLCLVTPHDTDLPAGKLSSVMFLIRLFTFLRSLPCIALRILTAQNFTRN